MDEVQHTASHEDRRDLTDEVGVTTSSFGGLVKADPGHGQISLFDLPRIMREELDMRVLDINTTTLGSLEADHVDRLREAAERVGCLITNLKMNQRGLELGSPEPAAREHALSVYRESIGAAARLGARWARPHCSQERPDTKVLVDGLRELADYAASHGIGLLVENGGWMASDPASVPELIHAVGHNFAASPDTGSWDDDVRYEGLARAFPLAVTCDYKAWDLGPNGEHEPYDLHRCFTIGREAGFRGPWCLEHPNRDRDSLFRELAMLRDMLRRWTEEG
jgi:hypothetical protein